MHSIYRHNDVERVGAPPQNGPRRDALAMAGAFATHPRADGTTLAVGVNRNRVSEMRYHGSDVIRRACIPRGRRCSHGGSFRERDGNGQAPRLPG